MPKLSLMVTTIIWAMLQIPKLSLMVTYNMGNASNE